MIESPVQRLTFGMQPRNPVITASDPWIRKHSRYISPRKVHAIGEVALAWSGVEHALILLAASITRIDAELAWSLFNDQGDIKLIGKIKLAEKIKPIPEELKKLLDNILKNYDQCRINRNSLIHNVGFLDRNSHSFRIKTKNYMETDYIKQSIGHIRRFADYIQEFASAIRGLSFCVSFYNEHGNFLVIDGGGLEIEKPEIMPPPETLVILVSSKSTRV